MLIRLVPQDAQPGTQISWFATTKPSSPQPGDIEADLLREYRVAGESDFWMEPGETYHIGTVMVLQPGNYLAMVTFVGNRRDKSDFWRRVFLIQVPSATTAPPTTLPAKSAS